MDMLTKLWEASEREVLDLGFGIEVPRWIEQDITLGTIAAIVQGGCASGAYMPAVTYIDALRIMGEYGDEVTEYLAGWMDAIEYDPQRKTWSGLAVTLLSTAVEAWAISVVDEINEALDEDGEGFSITHNEGGVT